MSAAPGITVIKTKAVIDGTGAKPLENAAVIVEGSTIKAVEPQGQASLPEGPHVRTLDFPNGYLLPGLVDVHTHLIFGVYGSSYEEIMDNDSDEIMLLRAAKNALTHLTCGVTTMRENGARNRVTFDLREGARRGYATTPRLFLCGRPVTLTGGHFYWCNQEADGVEGVRVAVRQLIKDGADHIKIMASGGGTAITDNRKASYSVEELRAIVDEAHNFGKLTTAHCLATQSLTNALDAGVDMIEHAGFIEPDGSYKFYPDIAERIAKQGVYVSPTVQTGYRQREVLLAREMERPLSVEEQKRLDGLKAKCESQLDFLGRMWKEWGISIISGTDAIQIFGDYCLGLELMSAAGMSNMDVIKGSTSTAAKSIGAGHLFGTVEAGKEADLIVVDQDPLQDIRALRSMAMVMRAGEQIL
ncbi:MAG: amidohydrolase family protein [Dehalococcoidia bacterium]